MSRALWAEEFGLIWAKQGMTGWDEGGRIHRTRCVQGLAASSTVWQAATAGSIHGGAGHGRAVKGRTERSDHDWLRGASLRRQIRACRHRVPRLVNKRRPQVQVIRGHFPSQYAKPKILRVASLQLASRPNNVLYKSLNPATSKHKSQPL